MSPARLPLSAPPDSTHTVPALRPLFAGSFQRRRVKFESKSMGRNPHKSAGNIEYFRGWCPGEGTNKCEWSTSYAVPPVRGVPLSSNVYFRDCPTRSAARWHPGRAYPNDGPPDRANMQAQSGAVVKRPVAWAVTVARTPDGKGQSGAPCRESGKMADRLAGIRGPLIERPSIECVGRMREAESADDRRVTRGHKRRVTTMALTAALTRRTKRVR